MSLLIQTFLPPGVQRKISERYGRIPRVMPIAAHDQIMGLWHRRNNCSESEVAAIDAEMETIARQVIERQIK